LETRLGSIDDLEGRLLFQATTAATFAEPGYLLYQQGSALLAQRFDSKRLRLVGSPVSLPDTPGGAGGYGGSYVLSASSSGTLLYHTLGALDSRLLWMDRTGRIVRTILRTPGYYALPAISPDGTRAVLSFLPSRGDMDLWVVDLERGLPIRLTHDPAVDFEPVWSPDGRDIVFTSSRGGSQSLYRLPAGGSREPVILLELDSSFNHATSWSRDGRFLVFRRLSPETGDDLWVLPMEGEHVPKPLLVTPFDEDCGSVSPDGRWMAYRSNESGRHEIYVQSFPDAGDRVRISTEGTVQTKGASPDIAWRADGGEIYFLAGDATTVMAAPVTAKPTFRGATPRPLFKLPRGFADYAVSADGEHFLVCAPGEESSSATFTIVMNWTSGLEGR
jgi:dipeptidyl aminopeptidase/acylaminoacyl peptidase